LEDKPGITEWNRGVRSMGKEEVTGGTTGEGTGLGTVGPEKKPRTGER